MSRPFQVVVQTDLDIAPPSMDSVPEPFPDKVLMGQISAPLGLRSSSPAALDVGDIARKLYLMAFEASNVRQPSNTVALDRLVGPGSPVSEANQLHNVPQAC
jgi:hypothetical protein